MARRMPDKHSFDLRNACKKEAAPRFELDKITIFSSLNATYGVKSAKATLNLGASNPAHLPLTFHWG